MPVHPPNVRSLPAMEETARRRWHVNVALSFAVVWCLIIWLAVLHLVGLVF